MSALHCFFCNGPACKYENHSLWSTPPNALPGLYSHWITPSILATQRPSTRLIRTHDLVSVFYEAGIRSVFNLQVGGEHASCGDGLDSRGGGFSYRAEDFMDRGIYHYNFGWQDMSTPNFNHMLSIVQVMAYALEHGDKIAVHCHAGLGRTGLAIACYFVYGEEMHPTDAIQKVRASRPLSLQTRKQTLFVHQFLEFISPFKIVFPGICLSPSNTTAVNSTDLVGLETCLERQGRMERGRERGKWRFVPRVVGVGCKGINEYVLAPGGDRESRARGVLESVEGYEGWNVVEDEMVIAMIHANTGDWNTLPPLFQCQKTYQLVLYWLTSLKDPLINDTVLNGLVTQGRLVNWTETVHVLGRARMYTLNTLLNPLRQIMEVYPTWKVDKAVRTIERVVTGERRGLRYPWVPKLLFVPPTTGTVSPSGPQTTSKPTVQSPTRNTTSPLPTPSPLHTFLTQLLTQYTLGDDGRPIPKVASGTSTFRQKERGPGEMADDEEEEEEEVEGAWISEPTLAAQLSTEMSTLSLLPTPDPPLSPAHSTPLLNPLLPDTLPIRPTSAYLHTIDTLQSQHQLPDPLAKRLRRAVAGGDVAVGNVFDAYFVGGVGVGNQAVVERFVRAVGDVLE
ncbi:hypothetical protein DFS34DRAFT_282607 [Phlyctochytrium arcticum]|nr:hypothetical protein DFS34DRAFT_282607 [Phlyctochytrium arcticum]